MFKIHEKQKKYGLSKFLLISLSIFSIQVAHSTTVQTIPPYLERELIDNNITGISIATIHHNRISPVENWGLADKESDRPITDTTLFSAASLSKTVFSYIVMQLVDEHKLDLDTPLYHYDPEEITDNPQYKLITARIVLSHRTGFPDWRPKGGKLTISFKPGERFSYSGEGYAYLQKAVESIEKQPLSVIADRRVFQPLGMTHSTYVSTFSPLMAEGYGNDGKRHDPFSSSGNAAYSLMTTAGDYALFLQAIMNGKSLSTQILQIMENPEVTVDADCTYCTDHPSGHPSKTLSWALGWGVEKADNHTYLWHWGDNTFFKAFVYMDPKNKNALVYFTNSENGLAIAPLMIWKTMGVRTQTLKWLDYKTVEY